MKDGHNPWLMALLLLSLLFAAVSINFSWVQGHHNSDTLLLPLISIERYTPYYWGDNRYGMLVPLLATPIRDYVWNTLFQTQILTLAAFGCVVAFHVWYLRPKPAFDVEALSGACLSVVLILLVLRPTPRTAEIFVLAHPYLLSLLPVLIAAGVLLRSQWRLPARLLLPFAALLAAFWINRSMAPLALALVAVLPAAMPYIKSVPVRLASLAIVVTAAVLAFAYGAGFPGSDATALVPLQTVPSAVAALATKTAEHIVHPFRLAVLLVAAALVCKRVGHSIDTLIFLSLAVGLAAAMASLKWVQAGQFEPRYWTSPLALVLLPSAAAVSQLVLRVLGPETAGKIVSALGLLLAAVLGFGIPSPGTARHTVVSASAVHQRGIIALRCTHFVGNYAAGWQAAFHQRATRPEKSLHALTMRAEVLANQWNAVPPDLRVYCGLCGDPEREFYEHHFGLPKMKLIGKSDGICVYEPSASW
ncbi:MAG: hypothetical protein SFV54_26595 [Bryobacteraceae bacterium]|nr:hypothetical protein [Bryobacteraceae bacterium]